MISDSTPFQITLVMAKHLYTELVLTQQLPEKLPPPHESIEDILVWTWDSNRWVESLMSAEELLRIPKNYPIRSWFEFRTGSFIDEYGNGSLAPRYLPTGSFRTILSVSCV